MSGPVDARRPAAPSSLARLWLRDALDCLEYERSRAASPGQALRCFIVGQSRRAVRLSRLGRRRFRALLEVEADCRRAGLTYPVGDNGQQAPWHLAERLLALRTDQLPPHPLIDGPHLARLLSGDAPPPPALEGLRALLRDTRLAARWNQLPLFGQADDEPPAARIAVCLHLFYPELWPELNAALCRMPEAWDLFVSVPDFAVTPVLAEIAKAVPRVRFLPCSNRGRDVLPWLRWLDAGAFDRYDWVCKLHTKRSPHMRDGAQWRARLLGGLLGTAPTLASRLAQLRAQPATGIAGPADALVRPEQAGWAGTNRPMLETLRRRLALPPSGDQAFFAGTMFWFRPAAVAGLRALAAAPFSPETGQTDGTLAHATERLVVAAVRAAGFDLLGWPTD